jgi:NADH:ubiquinone oxidoreductase subunit E
LLDLQKNIMIQVRICRGTLCHVMGGHNLPLLADKLPANWQNQIKIEGVSCLECCGENSGMKPPFVEVNGKIISEATIAKVMEAIRTEIKE